MYSLLPWALFGVGGAGFWGSIGRFPPVGHIFDMPAINRSQSCFHKELSVSGQCRRGDLQIESGPWSPFTRSADLGGFCGFAVQCLGSGGGFAHVAAGQWEEAAAGRSGSSSVEGGGWLHLGRQALEVAHAWS